MNQLAAGYPFMNSLPLGTRLNSKTPKQITAFLETAMHRFEAPDVYYGDEPNTFSVSAKKWRNASLRGVIQAPFDYLQAIGNNTIPLLYQMINEYGPADWVTERSYFPSDPSDVTAFDRAGIPLWGLESRHPLGAYDWLGVTLNYPPYFINVIKALRMSGIPVRWREREEMDQEYPLILVGGHIFADPWFPSPVADIIFLGEAEDETKEGYASAPPIHDEKAPHTSFKQHDPVDNPGLLAVLRDIADFKKTGDFYTKAGREDLLHRLAARYPFLFIPRFYDINHIKTERRARVDEKGWRIDPKTPWSKRYPDIPSRPTKRFVRNLDAVPLLTKPPVPYHNPKLGLGQVQIARGCSYHCNFCAASYREAPYRERSQSLMVQRFKDIMFNTGANEVSPLTLELGTYSRKKALIKQVLEEVTPKLSMPSLRIDVFAGDSVFGQLAVHAQKKNCTIALEGNSQRERELVSKGITEEDALRSIAYAMAAGYDSAKIYMIANLPGESEADLAEIVETCHKIYNMRKDAGNTMRVRLSWKPLTIQAHMPMQWLPARDWSVSIADAMKQIQALGFGCQLGDEARSGLGNYIQLAELSDDVSGEALVDAVLRYNKPTYGALNKAMFPIIEDELAKRDRSLADYYRRKEEDEIFAWDVVNTHITKGYLLRHYRKIKAKIDGVDIPIYGNGFLEKFGGCQIGCTACGACDDSQLAVMQEFAGRTDEAVKLQDIRKLDRFTVRQRFILTVNIEADKRFVTREHWRFALQRAMNQSGLLYAFDSVVFGAEGIKTLRPIFSGKDYVLLGLVRPEIDWMSVPERLNTILAQYNSGLTVLDIHQIGIQDTLKKMRVNSHLWELECSQDLNMLREAIRTMTPDMEMQYRIEKYRVGPVTEHIALNEVLKDAWVKIDGRVGKLVLLMNPLYSPFDVANALIGKRTDVYRFPANLRAALSVSEEDAFTKYCTSCDLPVPLEFGKPVGDQCPKCSDSAVEVLVT